MHEDRTGELKSSFCEKDQNQVDKLIVSSQTRNLRQRMHSEQMPLGPLDATPPGASPHRAAAALPESGMEAISVTYG